MEEAFQKRFMQRFAAKKIPAILRRGRVLEEKKKV